MCFPNWKSPLIYPESNQHRRRTNWWHHYKDNDLIHIPYKIYLTINCVRILVDQLAVLNWVLCIEI